MKRLSGFSLMEMMVVLLIVAVVAAASAPMVNKKMLNAASEKTPWVWTGLNNGIAYNLSGADRQIASIGATIPPQDGDNPLQSRMYIESTGTTPHITFGNEGNIQQRLSFFNRNIILSNEDINDGASNSVVIGNDASLTGAIENGISIGNNSTAGAADSTAIGADTQATANNTTAVGQDSHATANNAVALGASSRASGQNSIAIGSGDNLGARAIGDNSISIGNAATRMNGISVGHTHIIPDIPVTTLFYGNNITATFGDDRGTPRSLLALGDGIRIGGSFGNNRRINTGTDSIAIGFGTTAGGYSIAIGNNVVTDDEGSLGIGFNVRVNSDGTGMTDSYNTAVGYNTEATSSRYSSAFGNTARAIGGGSLALGSHATASGDSAIAISGSAADWYNNTDNFKRTTASADSSIAIGHRTSATNNNSIAIGHEASATHQNSVAIGPEAQTTNSNQIVLGNDETTVYIPGNIVIDGNSIISRNQGSSAYYRLYNESGKSFTALSNLNVSENKRGKTVVTGGTYGGIRDGQWDGVWNPNGQENSYTDSDRRLKNVGEVFTAGLDEIKKLEVFNYTYKKDPDKTPRVGVIAQDLQKMFPQAVFKGEDGFLRIRMEDMFYALVNAVKQLDAKIEEIKNNQIAQLLDKVTKLEEQNAKQEEINKKQEEMIEKLIKQNEEIISQNKEIVKQNKALKKALKKGE